MTRKKDMIRNEKDLNEYLELVQSKIDEYKLKNKI